MSHATSTISPTAPFHGKATDIAYDVHPSLSVRDGVTLYIRNGHVKAMVEHVDGSNSNVTFTTTRQYGTVLTTDGAYVATGWYSDSYPGMIRADQRRVLDSLAVALQGVTVTVGATLHHVILSGPALKGARARSIVRRFDFNAPSVSPGTIDAVTGVGTSVGATIHNERRNA